MTDKSKPDDVADHPNILPYASNVGAPVIKPDHSLAGWKHAAVHNANKYYADKYNDILKQIETLGEEFKINEMMYNAEMKIKPIIGKVYHVYRREGDDMYVSLFAPHERLGGKDSFVGSYRLNYDHRWESA